MAGQRCSSAGISIADSRLVGHGDSRAGGAEARPKRRLTSAALGCLAFGLDLSGLGRCPWTGGGDRCFFASDSVAANDIMGVDAACRGRGGCSGKLGIHDFVCANFGRVCTIVCGDPLGIRSRGWGRWGDA